LVALAGTNHSHIKSSSDDFQDQTDGLQQRSCCGKTIQCAGQSPPFDKKLKKKTKCVSYQHKKLLFKVYTLHPTGATKNRLDGY